MPVVRRPLKKSKSENVPTKPTATPALAAVSSDIVPSFLSAKQVEERLLASHHEIRKLVRSRLLVPIPYLGGRIKPWRFAVQNVDDIARRQIADALGSVA